MIFTPLPASRAMLSESTSAARTLEWFGTQNLQPWISAIEQQLTSQQTSLGIDDWIECQAYSVSEIMPSLTR
jgi:hypothetical protein